MAAVLVEAEVLSSPLRIDNTITHQAFFVTIPTFRDLGEGDPLDSKLTAVQHNATTIKRFVR